VSEPRRPPSIEPTGIFDGIRPGAILLGVIVDTVATIISGFVLVSFFAAEAAWQPDGDVPSDAFDAIVTSPTFLLASLVVGILCTILGAFAGARRAACFQVRHGAWIAVGSAGVALVSYAVAMPPEPNPLWFDIVGFTLIIPAGVAGGLLARYWPTGSEPLR
jgi:vacuolar-type H+-ATPase subunit I/STV1